MAVSTVSSLSEAFTAGVPLQVEEPAQGESGDKDKSGSPSGLPAIPEDGEENHEKDTSMADAEKPELKGTNEETPQVNEANGAAGDGEDADDGEDEEEDDAVLQVHD